MEDERQEKAKKYQAIKNWLLLADVLLTFCLLAAIARFNLQDVFIAFSSLAAGRFIQLFLFFLAFSIFFLLFQIPLSFLGTYWLEKRFDLSNHTVLSWAIDLGKREILSFLLALVLVFILYGLVWRDPESWWWQAWLLYIVISIVMGKIFPVVIVPIFYKYQPLPEGNLKVRILSLAERYGMKVKDIYSLDLSRTTKKANAAFCGLGKTKRIILGDNLLREFTDDEIEMVLAHELGHFKKMDIQKQLCFGAASSFSIFCIGFHLLKQVSPEFGYRGAPGDFDSFAMLCLIFFGMSLVMGPIGNAFSRRLERAADRFALEALQDKAVFISTMEKLARMNLADRKPHPLIEFLLYDHPPINKRMKMAYEQA